MKDNIITILDTEATGLDGRITEIGCIKIINGIITDEKYQTYLNPGENISKEVYKITGIDNKFLEDKPLFSDIVNDFLAFIDNTIIAAHNSDFDVCLINKELSLLNLPPISNKIIDTLILARKLYPGKKNSLSALCKRFRISDRVLHGALIDAEILAKVYLCMTSPEEIMLFQHNDEQIITQFRNTIIDISMDEIQAHEHLTKTFALQTLEKEEYVN